MFSILKPLVEVRDMCKIYNPGENEVRALDHVSLTIDQGEFVGIIGHSGSGKSTLMNMLGCLDIPTSGSYYLNGKDVSHMSDDELSDIRNVEIGFIFQGFNLIPNLTAQENVELPLIYRGVGKKEREALAQESLKMVGLAHRMDHKPSEMSGGQQQRVAIARAIAAKPPVILADEPTGNIDPETSYQLVELLKEICDTGKTIIIATHQYDLIEKFPGRVFCCEHGELYEKTPAKACECTEEVLPLPPIEEIIPDPSSEAGTIAPPNTEKIPEDTTAVNSEPETATIVEVTSETVNLTETPGQAATEIEDKTTNEDTTGDIMTLIGKLDYPEITAFDYELEHLPEIKPEDQEVAAEENADIPEIQEELPEKKRKKNLPPALDVELID